MFQLAPLTNQHELLCHVLRTAGSVDAACVVPPAHRGSIADILFEQHNVIVEVKSITTDRPQDDRVMQQVGELMMRDANMVVFGQVEVDIATIPHSAASKLLRVIGRRYQAEIKAANSQIRSTKRALDRQDAKGVVAFIAPPSKLRPDVVRWLVSDSLRRGRFSSVDSLIVAQTQLCGPGWGLETRNSWLAIADREGREMPDELKRRIANCWARVHQQPAVEFGSGEDFDRSFPPA